MPSPGLMSDHITAVSVLYKCAFGGDETVLLPHAAPAEKNVIRVVQVRRRRRAASATLTLINRFSLRSTSHNFLGRQNAASPSAYRLAQQRQRLFQVLMPLLSPLQLQLPPAHPALGNNLLRPIYWSREFAEVNEN